MEPTCLKSVLVGYEKQNNGKRRILTYLLATLPTLIFKELKTSIEQGTVVITLNSNKN